MDLGTFRLASASWEARQIRCWSFGIRLTHCLLPDVKNLERQGISDIGMGSPVIEGGGMLFVVVALGTAGDVNPMIGLAAELKSRGKKVVFLTNDFFKASVLSADLDFYSVGSEKIYFDNYYHQNIWHDTSIDSLDRQFKTYHIPQLIPVYEYIERVHLSGQDIVVVHNGQFNGAVLAISKYELKSVSVVLMPLSIPSLTEPHFPLSQLFSHPKFSFNKKLFVRSYFEKIGRTARFPGGYVEVILNLMRDLNIDRDPFTYEDTIRRFASADLLIALFPSWYAMPPRDWPPNIRYTNFPLYDTPSDRNKEKIENFIRDFGSPVVFTLGSGYNGESSFFSDAITACQSLGCPGILVSRNIKRFVDTIPDNILPIEYVDFVFLLARARAVVHHGGIGTLSQAISAGIPQLIVSMTFDQPDNGNRIRKLGLGDFIFPFEDVSAEWLIEKLQAAFDGLYDHSLGQFSKKIKDVRGLSMAADLIEECMP